MLCRRGIYVGDAGHPLHEQSHSKRLLTNWQVIRCLPALALVFLGLAYAMETASKEPRLYASETAGFELRYPATWIIGPATFRNATEFRNYDESHQVPERDEARILVTCEDPGSPERARQRVDELVKAASERPKFQLETFQTGEGLLYLWSALEPPAVPAQKKSGVPVRMRLRVSAALVGVPLVRAEGTTWEDASPQIVSEIRDIARSIRLARKGGK